MIASTQQYPLMLLSSKRDVSSFVSPNVICLSGFIYLLSPLNSIVMLIDQFHNLTNTSSPTDHKEIENNCRFKIQL